MGGKLKRKRNVDRFDRIVTIGTTGRFGKFYMPLVATGSDVCVGVLSRGGSLERNWFGWIPGRAPAIGWPDENRLYHR
jgi:hypothetical protein